MLTERLVRAKLASVEHGIKKRRLHGSVILVEDDEAIEPVPDVCPAPEAPAPAAPAPAAPAPEEFDAGNFAKYSDAAAFWIRAGLSNGEWLRSELRGKMIEKMSPGEVKKRNFQKYRPDCR